jgi:hypothetical protein
MKLHLEQLKSEKLAKKVDTLGKSYAEKEEEVQNCLRQLAEMRETAQCLHEELEKQDVVIDDARCINQSYQERYQELQAKAEQYQEESAAHPRSLHRDIDTSKISSEVDYFPKLSSWIARGIDAYTPSQLEIPIRRRSSSQSRPSDQQAVLRPSPTADNGEIERSRSSSTTRSLSSCTRSPVLPEPSDEDLLSLYRLCQGYAENDDQTLRSAKAKWFPKFTIEEIRERTKASAKFFEDAKELLGDLPSPIERSLVHPSGFKICGNQANEQQTEEGTDKDTSTGTLSAEHPHWPIYEEESAKSTWECHLKIPEINPSEISFEEVAFPQLETSFTPQPNITDGWLQCVPSYSYPASISQSSGPISTTTVVSNPRVNPREIISNIEDLVHSPLSSSPDIWLEEALSSTGEIHSPSKRLTQQRRQYNYPESNFDISSDLAISSPVMPEKRRQYSLHDLNWPCMRLETIPAESQLPLRDQAPAQSQPPPSTQPPDHTIHTHAHPRGLSDDDQSQLLLTLGRPPPSFISDAASLVARKLRLPYVGSARKPRVTMPRASSSGKRQGCDMQLVTPSRDAPPGRPFQRPPKAMKCTCVGEVKAAYQ